MLIHEDCLKAMKSLEQNSVDLIYLDPPFFTQKKHVLADRSGMEYSFDDTWCSMDAYITYLTERLVEAKRVLKESGSIFLHCDTYASHHLRIALDAIFGEENFRSEIIWSYKRWSNSKKGLLNAHQTIYFYSKTKQYKFHTSFTDYSPTTNVDQLLQERKKNGVGKSIYKIDINGNVVLSKEKRGVPLSDVWEIPFLNPKAKERVGYPTQKPILLLERIIKLCTDEGDMILDPFCGSGTTLVAARLMRRHFIGIDKSIEAVTLAKKRLDHPFKSQSLLLNNGKDSFNTKTLFEKSILSQLKCNVVQRNKGIDAILKKYYNSSPVAIRIQKEDEKLSEAAFLLAEASKKTKCSFSILIKTNSLPEEKEIELPQNVHILDCYQLAIENYLQTIVG